MPINYLKSNFTTSIRIKVQCLSLLLLSEKALFARYTPKTAGGMEVEMRDYSVLQHAHLACGGSNYRWRKKAPFR